MYIGSHPINQLGVHFPLHDEINDAVGIGRGLLGDSVGKWEDWVARKGQMVSGELPPAFVDEFSVPLGVGCVPGIDVFDAVTFTEDPMVAGDVMVDWVVTLSSLRTKLFEKHKDNKRISPWRFTYSRKAGLPITAVQQEILQTAAIILCRTWSAISNLSRIVENSKQIGGREIHIEPFGITKIVEAEDTSFTDGLSEVLKGENTHGTMINGFIGMGFAEGPDETQLRK
ncbi:hypothetical protein B0H10DRAFT_1940488 [Mycena sp. CBHHK59/15]|nr:hypothetical protein B0H10DRAFT_1940488 [Mycena sp. CBHHK59/15]